MIDSSILVTTRQAADLLDVHESSIKRWCSLGQLTCEQTPGGHRRISFDVLMEFSKQRDIFCPLHAFDEYAGRTWSGAMHAKKTGDFTSLSNLATDWLIHKETYHLLELLQYMSTMGYNVAVQMDQIIAPVMYAVGQAYLKGTLSIGDEHRLTYLIRDILIRLSHKHASAHNARPYKKVILGCIRSQEHELGCLMARLVLESEGWDVIYLGLDVPTEEFARMQINENAPMICIALMPPTTGPEVTHIIDLLGHMYDRKKPYHLIFGGPVHLDLSPNQAAGHPIDSVHHFLRMKDFSDWLQETSEKQQKTIS